MELALVLAALTTAIVAAPRRFDLAPARFDAIRRAGVLVSLFVAIAAHQAPVAFAATAVGLLLQAAAARTRTGAAWTLIAVVGLAVAAATGGSTLFVASLLALAIRLGVIPLHGGVASLAERHPALLVELAGSALVEVYVHLRFAIPAAPQLADDAATVIVGWGAGAALVGALLALVQPTLRGLWSTSYTMHAGMVLAAVGAAGRGHVVAAVFVAVTLALALSGFGATVLALEARVGVVDLRGAGGRARAFPRLASAFAFFAAAGIALPGTAGFIADDLLLHALWGEAPAACGIVLLASATLAVALLRGFSAVFLGPEAGRALAPDLDATDRAVFVAGMLALLAIGVAPMPLITWITRAL